MIGLVVTITRDTGASAVLQEQLRGAGSDGAFGPNCPLRMGSYLISGVAFIYAVVVLATSIIDAHLEVISFVWAFMD